MTSTLLLIASFGAAVPAFGVSPSEEWPQFGGPNRDFHAPASRLAGTWPETGPPVLWRRRLGDGYSGVLVDGDRLYTMYRRDGQEHVIAVARGTGATEWDHSYAVETTPSAQQFGDGPSSTPVLTAERIVAVGVGIDVHCFDKARGKVLWSRHIMEEFELSMPGRGFSVSPLVVDDLVILPIGGNDAVAAIDDVAQEGIPGGAIVALRLSTGEFAWTSQEFPGAKASPLLIQLDGQSQVVVFMGNELAGLDPATGELLWRHPHATDYGFNNSTPVFDGVDTLVCSSAYNQAAEAIRLVPGSHGITVEPLWKSRRLRVHFTNLVLVEDRLYGIGGMGRPAFLTCLDLASGKALWRERGFARGNIVYAGGPFVILDEDGLLALATFTDDGPEIHGSIDIADSHAFASPTLVGSSLYVRDRKHLTAFDLSPEGVAALASGKGNAFEPERPDLREDIEDLVGTYETESPDPESTLRLHVDQGRLELELDGETFHLALQEGSELYDFVEDRTSGSTPRTFEFLADEDGLIYQARVRSPAHPPLVYWRTE